MAPRQTPHNTTPSTAPYATINSNSMLDNILERINKATECAVEMRNASFNTLVETWGPDAVSESATVDSSEKQESVSPVLPKYEELMRALNRLDFYLVETNEHVAQIRRRM